MVLKVYKDSWAYDFLENGWDEACKEYCEEYEAKMGSTPEELNQVPVKPNYEVLDE